MLTRVLAVLGVGVWCLFLLLVSVGLVIDRGLADVGIVWLARLRYRGRGPRASSQADKPRHRGPRRIPSSRSPARGRRRKSSSKPWEEGGEITPSTAVMRTSLTVDEASKMLKELARKGHLEMQMEEGIMAYSLGERRRQALPGGDLTSPRSRSRQSPTWLLPPGSKIP